MSDETITVELHREDIVYLTTFLTEYSEIQSTVGNFYERDRAKDIRKELYSQHSDKL